MSISHIMRIHVGLIMLWFAGGCGRESAFERVPIAGEVTYNGQPVELGTIRFIPAEDAKLPSSGAIIRQGKYLADSKCGVPVGKYRVSIEPQGAGSMTNIEDATTSAKAPGPSLPAKFNSESELTISVESGQPPPAGDFHLVDQRRHVPAGASGR